MAGELEGAAGVFIGIGFMALLFVLAYFVYQMTRIFKQSADREGEYNLFEIFCLNKVSKLKGIDMEREKIRLGLTRTKSFRRKLEEEMIKEIFPDKKEALEKKDKEVK